MLAVAANILAISKKVKAIGDFIAVYTTINTSFNGEDSVSIKLYRY